MLRIFRIVYAALVLALVAELLCADTPVVGFIAQDTIWTKANSPYVTLGNVVVKEGVTLTIEPGVTVYFGSGYNLTVEGTLIASGTETDNIVFTSKNASRGSWGGIIFGDRSMGAKFDEANNYLSGSILQYCVVEFAEIGVSADWIVAFFSNTPKTPDSASLLIDHSIFTNCKRGIVISKGETVVIRDSKFMDNNGLGWTTIGVDAKTVIVNNDTFNRNIGTSTVGIRSQFATLEGNTFIGNNALHMGGGVCIITHTGIIKNNTFSENIVAKYSSTAYGTYAEVEGGGMHLRCVIATISGNTFDRNRAVTYGGHEARCFGGGLYIAMMHPGNHRHGSAVIENNSFSGNMAECLTEDGQTSRGGSYAGGMFLDSGGLVPDDFGDLPFESGSIIVRNNTFVGNKGAEDSAMRIFGYASGYPPIMISNNTFIGNVSNLTGSVINVDNTSGVAISNNSVKENIGSGIYVTPKTENIIINSNTLIGNIAHNGGGIRGHGMITNNVITGNRIKTSAGAAIYYLGNQDITGNLIASNIAERTDNTNAVYIKGNPKLYKNAFVHNQTKYELYFDQQKGSPDLDATNNYWGATTEAEILMKIYDFFQDGKLAVVKFVPFLTEPPVLPNLESSPYIDHQSKIQTGTQQEHKSRK